MICAGDLTETPLVRSTEALAGGLPRASFCKAIIVSASWVGGFRDGLKPPGFPLGFLHFNGMEMNLVPERL